MTRAHTPDREGGSLSAPASRASLEWHGRRASQAEGKAPGQSDARSTPARRTGLDGHVNYMLVMRNKREDLVAIGPVPIEYEAAMIRDELEESAGWTTVGIARVLTEKQARTIAAAGS
jgi:hypothetical protein